MAGMFDDILNEEPSGGMFDDILADKAPAPTTMQEASGKQLPPLWETEVTMSGQPVPVRGVLSEDNGKRVYLVGNRDGSASYINKNPDGTLGLKPYKEKVSSAGTGLQNFAAGAGKSFFVDPARGIKQIGSLVGNTLGMVDDSTVDDVMADVQQSRARDAELSDTKAGMAGQVTGAIASALGGGLALRGAGQGVQYASSILGGAANAPRIAQAGVAAGRVIDTAGRALYAPASYKQAAGSGAAIGALQPAESGMERLASTGLGAAGAAGGQYIGTKAAQALTKGHASRAAGSSAPDSQDVIDAVVAPSTQRLGLSYGDLPAKFQQAIASKVDESMKGGIDMTPEQAARAAIYEQLGIKPTRALVTRDMGDALNEQNLLTEVEGAALRKIYEGNNAAFRQRIRDLAPAGVEATEAPVFGATFRGDIRTGERAAQKAVGKVYDAAKAAEGANMADVGELANFISQNKSRLLASGDQGKFVLGYLEDMDALGENGLAQALKGGKASASDVQIPLSQLTDLRAIVNSAWRSAADDNAKAVLGQMRGMLNKSEWQAGGQITKQAREARQAKGNLYENNPLVDQLLSKRRGYNADLVEDSQVFDKAILQSTPEQFSAAWRATSDSKTKDLTRAQVASWLEKQVFDGQAMNQADVIASSAKMQRALERLGAQKLRAIYGADKAAELKILQKALKEVSNPPKGTVPQGSAPKIQFYFRQVMSLLGKTPLAGNMVEGLAKVGEIGAASKVSRDAAKKATDFTVKRLAKPSPLASAAGAGATIPLADRLKGR